MRKRAGRLTSTILQIAVASIILVCPLLSAQSAPAPVPVPASSLTTDAVPGSSFEVATIKPHQDASASFGMGMRAIPDGMNAVSVSLHMLVRAAYSSQIDDQISGAPEWANAARFDVQAKMAETDAAEIAKLSSVEANARRQLMMQTLLADRFKLKVHFETGQAPVYELVVAKGTPKLDPVPADSSDDQLGKPKVDIMVRNGTCVVRKISMENFVRFLSTPNGGTGRRVIDKTGLTGTYNFTLNWSGANLGRNPSLDDGLSIFSALKEIGLKLEPAIAPNRIIVIDHAERPSEN